MPHIDLNEVNVGAKRVSNTKDNVAITEASANN